MKILVVDDEKLLVKGIKFNLENEGYTVEACYDGQTGGTLNTLRYAVEKNVRILHLSIE